MTASDKTIVIFGSSSAKPGDDLYSLARELGRLLAVAGFRICNGGYDGIMEASAKGAKDAGGASIGITTKELKGSKRNPWIDNEVILDAYMQRMEIMFQSGDGFVVLPGGVGTFSELFTLWCLFAIKAMETKPLILVGDLWEKLFTVLTTHFCFGPGHMAHLITVQSPEEAVKVLRLAFPQAQSNT